MSISFKLLTIILLASLFACNSAPEPYARPFGFPRIEIPKEIKYKKFDNKTCPFTFEYPEFGTVSRDLADSCWVDIYFPRYDCKWHISHHSVVKGQKDRNARFEDFRKLVYKHIKKASNIPETPLKTQNGYGVKYELYGNVGTPVELFFGNETDVLTASFYFNTAQKNDSLAPVIDYMKGQMNHLVETIEWK